jgi:DNA primase
VTLLFDGDAAGGAATERGIGLLLAAGIRVRVVALPSGEDPDSFLQQHGKEAFLRCVDEAVTFVEYLLARAKRFYDVQTPTGQADCVARILPLLRQVENQVEQWGYLTLLAEKIGLPVEVLQREMGQRSMSRPAGQAKPQQPSLVAHYTPSLSPVEYGLLKLLLNDNHLLAQVRQQITIDDFQEPILRELYALLLRLAPGEGVDAFANMLAHVSSDTQQQLLAKMAMEPVVDDVAARHQALEDYIVRLQEQKLKAKLRHLQASIREAERAGDADAQHRLLQAYTALHNEKRYHYQRG